MTRLRVIQDEQPHVETYRLKQIKLERENRLLRKLVAHLREHLSEESRAYNKTVVRYRITSHNLSRTAALYYAMIMLFFGYKKDINATDLVISDTLNNLDFKARFWYRMSLLLGFIMLVSTLVHIFR